MNNVMRNSLTILTRKELFVFAAEANSRNDTELLDMITDEIKSRDEIPGLEE